MRPHLAALSAVLACAAVLAGCGSSGSDTSTTKTTTAPKRAVSVVYATPTDQDLAVGKELLTAGGTTKVAKALASNFNLPWNMKVLVRNTSDTGPYYNPENHSINLDYAFVDFILKQVKRINPKISDYDLGKSVAAINSFLYVHEFAHLLIDAYDLPITGGEEDAADQLATLFMVKFVDGGGDYAFDAAEFFDSIAQDPSQLKQEDFFDEHSLNQQRAYNIVCWIAGSSDARYKAIEKLGVLGEERLQRCPDEYAQIDHAWTTLMEPHFAASAKDGKTSTTAN